MMHSKIITHPFVLILMVLLCTGLYSSIAESKEDTTDANNSAKQVKQFSHYKYLVSINNLSGNKNASPLKRKDFNRFRFIENRLVYRMTLPAKNKKKIINVTRFGFFETKKEARQFSKLLRSATKSQYTIRVLKIPKGEKRYLASWVVKNRKLRPNLSQEELELRNLNLLMEEARQAMIKHDYRSAISNYSKVTKFEGTEFFKAALEYLGLARERNRQFAHAKAEYERYLKLFPEGEGSVRVQQRLNAMLSAELAPRKKLRKSKRRISKSGWRSAGSIFQFYRQDVDLDSASGNSISTTNLYSSLFYSSRYKSLKYEMKNRISLRHFYDLEENDEDNDLVKISTLSTEMHSRKMKLTSQIGRQSLNGSGVFGRFDGVVLTHNSTPKLNLRAVTGYPVDFDTYDEIQDNRVFYSVNAEFESLLGVVDLNTYLFTQYHDDIVDRQSFGMDFRHFSQKVTFYSTLDYDYLYSLVNNFIVNTSYKLSKKNSIGIYFTFRRSPLIATTNALQGQTVDTLNELLEDLSKDELRQLAKDRTAEYMSNSINWKRKLSQKYEINYDYTLSRLSGTKSSQSIIGTEDTGFEHYLSAQLIANNIFRQYDVSVLNFRLEKRSTGNRATIYLIRRDPFSRKVSLSSKLKLDFQDRKDGANYYDIRPSGKLNYRFNKRYKVEFELGFSHRIRRNSLDDENETNGFFSLGYIAQF